MAVAFTSHPYASPPVISEPVADRRPSGVFGRRVASKRSAAARRRHGATVPFDRDELERSGWRTMLDYHENHVRRRDGRLDQLEAVWRATGERIEPDGEVSVVTATAHTAAEAWSRLRHEADLAGSVRRGSRGSPDTRPGTPRRRARP